MIGKERRSMHFMNFIDFIGRFDSRFIFSFYSASVFYIVRPVRLDRSVKAFVDFIGSSPAQKNKIFCFSEQEKNSLTGGTPHFVRQTPPVGRSENLTGHSFLLQWSSGIKPFISRQSLTGKGNTSGNLQQ